MHARKIRKGTTSCWECKRRKVRCLYTSPADQKCAECERRFTACVKQNHSLPDALNQSVVVSHDHITPNSATTSHSRRPSTAHPSSPIPLTPSDSLDRVPLPLPLPSTQHTSHEHHAAYHPEWATTEVVNSVLAAFPSGDDLQFLLQECSQPCLYVTLIYTQPYAKLESAIQGDVLPLIARPSRNDHPVALAKQMLLLAVVLQSPCGQKFSSLSQSPAEVGRRLVDAATKWVTTKEEIYASIEGLFCVMLEGVYKANCGQLRQAWAVFRKAIAIGQMLGLHRPCSHVAAQARIEHQFKPNKQTMWFRIMYMDRSLSMLLGLPPGTTSKSTEMLSGYQQDSTLGQFEVRLADIASRVLDRNEGPTTPAEMISITQLIDGHILCASERMPASFWRPISFAGMTPASPENLFEMLRLQAHVHYHALLMYLHLPFLMHGVNGKSEDEHNGYSEVTCVNASREIVSRFITHRAFSPVSTCSRLVDFYALLAAMTLVLAHLDAKSHQHINLLAHQRLGDLALLEQVLERMDTMANSNCQDVLIERSAKLIRRLMEVEADAARGNQYTITIAREADEDKNTDLHFRIPYLGVVKISRLQDTPVNDVSIPTDNQGRYSSTDSSAAQSLSQNTDQTGTTWTADTSVPSQCPAMQHAQSVDKRQESRDVTGGMEQYNDPVSNWQLSDNTMDHFLPPLAADAEQWAFQGVDWAFVNTLVRGAASNSGDYLCPRDY